MPNMIMRDEIDIVSVAGNELYAYVSKVSYGKDWPQEIEHLGLRYEFDAKWDLPTQMKTYTQAARYLLIAP